MCIFTRNRTVAKCYCFCLFKEETVNNINLNEFMEKLTEYPQLEREEISKAYQYASSLHEGQYRQKRK